MRKNSLPSTVHAASAGPCLSPRGLAALEGLSRLERIMVLRQWERAELATGESTEDGRSEASRTRLREIAQAITRLKYHPAPEAPESEGETEPDRLGGEPRETPSPPAPVSEPRDPEERWPFASIQWVQAALFVGLLGFLFALETQGGDVAVGMIVLCIVILLVVFLRHRPQPGRRV